MGKSLQQVKKKHCTKKLLWQIIMLKFLNCQRDIVTKYLR